MKRRTFLSLMGAAALTSGAMLTGCGAGSDDDRKIVRIGHVQSQTHPDHLGLEAFADHINEKLGGNLHPKVRRNSLSIPTGCAATASRMSTSYRADRVRDHP